MLCSLALDGELDPLERELRRHLRACAGCASAVAEVEALTTVLRGSRRERPERPVELRPVRHGIGVRSSVLAAAAIAVAASAGLTGLAGSSGSPITAHRTSAFVSDVVAVSVSDPDRLSVLRHWVGV